MSTFNEFWAAYPRKRERIAGENAWKKAATKFGPDAIMKALEEMKRTEWKHRKPEFIPYAASWIRATDFDDEFEAREDDKEPMSLFTQMETNENLTDRAELIHRNLTREQELWRRNAADHTHTERCGWGQVCVYRQEPRVPTLDELLQHLKAGR